MEKNFLNQNSIQREKVIFVVYFISNVSIILGPVWFS